MLTPTCIARHCDVTLDQVRRWQHSILVGPYQRPVRLADRPSIHDLLEFLAAADGHWSLDPVPQHLMKSARRRRASMLAVDQAQDPPALRSSR